MAVGHLFDSRREDLDARVYADELHIRAQLKSITPNAIFSLNGMHIRNANAAKALGGNAGFPSDVKVFQEGFDSLERGSPASAACAFEKCRMRLWALSSIRRHFSGDADLHFTTLVDLRHRCVGADLERHTANRSFYQLTQASRLLSKLPLDWKMLAVAEISAVRVNGVMMFEPHIHIVTAGLEKSELVKVLPRSVAPFSRRICSISNIEICALYMSKIAPEMRSGYQAVGSSRPSRRRNKMRPSELAQWLRWHSSVKISELVMTRGFPNDLMRRSISEMIDELAGPLHGFNRRWLPERKRSPTQPVSARHH